VPKPQRIEVVVEPTAVIAYLLASRERQIAARIWELIPAEGIIITCQCEKGASCLANNKVMRPADPPDLGKQLVGEIDRFRREYGIPVKKVKFNRQVGRSYEPMNRLRLFGLWQDEQAIKAAQAAFDRM